MVTRPSAPRANPERNFQMAEAKWPVCTEEAKANVHRPWPCADDTADRPLRPGRLPSTSERIAWERAGAARGLWLCCVGRPSPMGIGLPPRLARDPSALPPFRKFISGFALNPGCAAQRLQGVALIRRVLQSAGLIGSTVRARHRERLQAPWLWHNAPWRVGGKAVALLHKGLPD